MKRNRMIVLLSTITIATTFKLHAVQTPSTNHQLQATVKINHTSKSPRLNLEKGLAGATKVTQKVRAAAGI